MYQNAFTATRRRAINIRYVRPLETLMENKTVAVRSIYLDTRNPRHDPIANESEILAHLLKNEDVRPLARSIAQLGSLNPLELLALVPHPIVRNKFVAAEGNRRICALKLLLDPDKAPTERDKKFFRALKDQMPKAIRTVDATIFEDMLSTRTWVGLRHDGAQGGVGTKAWRAPQSTRFKLQGDGNTPNAQALRILDHARQRQLLSEDDIDSIGITTITRFLSNPVVRSALGLADSRSLAITVPQDEFERALTRFLLDAVGDDPKVHSRTKAPERAAYGQSLSADGYAPTTRGLEPYEPASGAGALSNSSLDAPNQERPKKLRNVRSRDEDRCVVPQGFVAAVADPVFQRLFQELKTLGAEQFSFAATYLLRAVIEQATALFLRKHGITPPSEMHKKLLKAVDILERQQYSGRGLNALRKMSSDIDSKYSPDTIGNFIHGGAVPTKINAIRLWDTFEPIMTEFLRQLSAPKSPGQAQQQSVPSV